MATQANKVRGPIKNISAYYPAMEGFGIFQVQTSAGQVTVMGRIDAPRVDMIIDVTVRANPRGNGFLFDDGAEVEPQNLRELESYGKSIGLANFQIKGILQQHGLNALQILQRTPEQLLGQFGIDAQQLAARSEEHT